MFRKTTVVVLLSVCVFAASQTQASEPNDYIIPGRSLLFDGTVSGLRAAYETFDNGLNDSNCVDCNSSRELILLHAVTRIAMWAVKDNGNPIDSAVEFAREFDVELLGDYWYELDINYPDSNYPVNQHDAYEIPEDAPDIINEILDFIDTSAIPEITAVIDELNLITDSPSDRFRLFFDPNETSMFFEPNMPGLENDVEVDYGEVLMLKGLLMGLKAMLQSQLAHDVFIDANDMLVEKIYGDCFNINVDLLEPHPDLLKVLPTANDSNDGAAVLAQVRQDWIDSVNYYLDAIDYIRAENDPPGTDPQEDELLYIDPNHELVFTEIDDKLITIRDSLIDDTMESYVFETTKTYDVQCSGSNTIGKLELVYDLIGLEDRGSLILDKCVGAPAKWAFEDFSTSGNELYIEMDYEGCGINYMYAQSLNDAKSVLFTPVDCGTGSNTYKSELLPESLFSTTGTAQGWNGYNQSWLYSLPFTFQFFGTAYTSVYVCTNGFLDFADSGYYYWDIENKVRIEPFGTSLRTDGGGSYDIYIEQVDSNEVKFRWDADRSGNQCNFSVSLFSDESIRFDYGPGNNNSSPYAGISNGSYDSCIKLYGGYGSGLFYGTISQDHNSITNATFEYWGNPSGTLTSLSGQIAVVEVQDVNVDFNPVFGSSVRYPNPVNPRDLLPVFDEWHAAQPNTIGHGLSDDATLGGILPDMTQYDWQVLLNLQPSGLFYLDFISPWQVTVDGNVNDWSAAQLIFADITGDTDEDSNDVNGVDIESVYMAYDWENVYGAMSLNDPVVDSGQERKYILIMSYSPDNTSTLDSLKVEIYTSETYSYGRLYHMASNEYGWVGWQNIADLDFAVGESAVEFKVPFEDIPSYLPGRFISVECSGQENLSWRQKDGEQNTTHLKIGEVGSISGTVSYNGYRGEPIFVQAYTDPEDPEGSIVASTMILEPGLYTLENIGLGWQGYVRAFTPLFGFDNPFELEAFDIETRTTVFLPDIHLDDIDIVLNNPPILENDVWEFGEIDADTREIDWHAFDAVQGGTYMLDLTRGTADYACITLYGRDGDTELIELYDWQTQQINWLCPLSGRYYVKVANGYYQPDGGTYQIRMTSDLTCPQADIACAEWVGVKDCKVDFYDLSVLVSHWLDSCSDPYWCDDTDFNESGSVDFSDFATLANEWLMDGSL